MSIVVHTFWKKVNKKGKALTKQNRERARNKREKINTKQTNKKVNKPLQKQKNNEIKNK